MKKTSFFKWIFLFLIVCCACSSLTKNRSSNILPLDSVAVMLAECFIMEGEIFTYQWTYNTTDYSFVQYDSFFRKHEITPEIFMQNVRYYLTHKKYADEVMEKASNIVDQRVAALRDSLNIEQ